MEGKIVRNIEDIINEKIELLKTFGIGDDDTEGMVRAVLEKLVENRRYEVAVLALNIYCDHCIAAHLEDELFRNLMDAGMIDEEVKTEGE